MSKNLSPLAINLKRLRDERGFSQKKLGELAQIPWRSIQNAELGVSDLGADALLALAGVFGMTVDDLIRDKLSEQAVKPIPQEITPKEALEVLECSLREFHRVAKDPLIKRILSLPEERKKLIEKVIDDPFSIAHQIPENIKKLIEILPDDEELWGLLLQTDKTDWDVAKDLFRDRIEERAKILKNKIRLSVKRTGAE